MSESLKIRIDFLRGRQRPEEIFQAMSSYIEGYQALGQVIANSVGEKDNINLKLENIETNSIASLLNLANETGKWLGDIFFSSSLKLVEELSTTESTETEDDVDSIAQTLESEVARNLPNQYPDPQIDRKALAEALSKISTANKKLMPEETASASLKNENNVFQINTHWRFKNNPKEMFLGEISQHSGTELLYVKAPMNIGKGVWQFVRISDGKSYSARVLDSVWLESYQSGSISAIGPKDVMEAEVSLDIHTPPLGKGKPQVRNLKIKRVIKINKNNEHQYELPPT